MKKGISYLLASLLLLTSLAACSSDTPEGSQTTANPSKSSTDSAESSDDVDPVDVDAIRGGEATDEAKEIVNNTLNDSYLGDLFDTVIPSEYGAYPLDNPEIDVWMPIDGFLASLDGNLNNFYVYQKAQELTGIKVNFISPAAGTEAENFTTMVSSQANLPDIIVQADRYPGGLEAGMEDGAYIELTDQLEEWAPNYHAFRNADETRRRVSITDSGKVIGFHGLSPYPEWIWFGLLIKQEALDLTGLPVPETIDEWEIFLEKCQEVGFSEPLNYGSTYGQIFTDTFNGAYGVFDWRYIDEDNKVQWGPAESQAKEYLETMRRWQEKGFFNPDWTTADYNARMAHASSEKAAVILDSPDTMWGVWKTDNDIDFVGAPNPVLKKGDKPMTTYKNWTNTGNPAAITTNSDNVEAAMRWLDFGYSKKGWELFNYGEYGTVHLIDEDGIPYFHDESLMYNDPDNHPLAQLIWKYRVHSGPNIRDEHNSNPLIVAPGSYSGDIRQMWTEEEDALHAFPPVSLTQAESSTEASLGTQLATLRGEYFAKIIMGEYDLDAYDEFLEQAKTIGLDEWINVNQAGVDRYFDR